MDNNTLMTEEFINTVVELCLSKKPEDLIFGISAPTGSGKSTNLMERIQTLTTEKLDDNTIVFVLQRTIAAVKSLNDRMKQLFGSNISIGYAAESNINYTSNTEIVYCTGGHLENKMLSMYEDGKPKRDINFCSFLIIDEAHTNSLDQETVVALWKEALIQGFSVPKLIFISATLNMNDIGFPKAKVISIKSKSFPIELNWYNTDYPIDSKRLYEDTANLIFNNHLITPIKKVNKKADKNNIIWPGYDTWLCFCPGQKEVITVTNELKKLIEKSNADSDSNDSDSDDSDKLTDNIELIPIYGSMNSDVYMKIFVPPKQGIRRIIISTNLAESSITISFVTWIYDTMTEKYTKTTPNGGEILVLDNISRASSEQRKGRTGRVCPGQVTRMCSENYFNSDKLVDQRLPEIKRVPLHNMIIKLLSVGLDPAKLFRNRIDENNLKISIKTLTFLGMLEKDDEGKTFVTDMGHFATRFAISVRGSAILWRWIQSRYPIFPGIVITCLIDCYDNQSYFFYNFNINNHDNTEYYETYFRKYAGCPPRNGQPPTTGLTDIEVLIVMWHHLMYSLGGVLRPKKSALKKYCNDNSLNQKKIAECLNAIAKVYGTLNRSVEEEIKLTAFSPAEGVENISKILNHVYADNICNLVANKEKQKLYRKAFKPDFYNLDIRSPLTLNSSIYNKILAIRTRESQVGVTNKNFITLSIPTDINPKFFIPDEYEIDYSETKKINTNDNDDDIVGDDPEDIFENEFLPVKLPLSNKTLFKNRNFFDTSPIAMPSYDRNETKTNKSRNVNSICKEYGIPLKTIKKSPTTIKDKKVSKNDAELIESIQPKEEEIVKVERKADRYKKIIDSDDDD